MSRFAELELSRTNPTTEVIEEIARQVADGCTSGRLDDGDGKHTSWDLTTETWTDALSEVVAP